MEKICFKLPIDVPEQNVFEHLDTWTFLLITFSRFGTVGVSASNFKLVKVGLVVLKLYIAFFAKKKESIL